jgi:hypothetical protein
MQGCHPRCSSGRPPGCPLMCTPCASKVCLIGCPPGESSRRTHSPFYWFIEKPFRIWHCIRRENRCEFQQNRFPRGQWPRVNRSRSYQLLTYCKETVCKAFCILFFRQLATIKTTTQSANHFTSVYNVFLHKNKSYKIFDERVTINGVKFSINDAHLW